MKLNEDWFEEIEVPIVIDTEKELTIDEIEDNEVATPEENGVATIITNSISDTWQKINDYNSIIATVSDTDVENKDDIISVVQDIIEDENKNIGRLMSALSEVNPSVDNVEVGQEEANMKLTEDFEESKVDILSDVLGKSLSSTEENYIYDNWRAFYDDPESFRDSDVVNMILDGLNIDLEDSKLDLENEDDEEMEDTVVIDDNFIEESLSEDIQKPIEKKPNIIGTIRYDANEGRKKRVELYKKLTSLNEDAQLTEDNLKKWAVDRVACFTNTTPDRVRSELLGNKWSEFEED